MIQEPPNCPNWLLETCHVYSTLYLGLDSGADGSTPVQNSQRYGDLSSEKGNESNEAEESRRHSGAGLYPVVEEGVEGWIREGYGTAVRVLLCSSMGTSS